MCYLNLTELLDRVLFLVCVGSPSQVVQQSRIVFMCHFLSTDSPPSPINHQLIKNPCTSELQFRTLIEWLSFYVISRRNANQKWHPTHRRLENILDKSQWNHATDTKLASMWVSPRNGIRIQRRHHFRVQRGEHAHRRKCHLDSTWPPRFPGGLPVFAWTSPRPPAGDRA